MLVALLSDLHANADALSAVLVEARARGVHRLLVAGDYVGYYYEPDRVLRLLDEWPWVGIRGNHERLLDQWRRGEGRDELQKKYGSGFAAAEAVLTPEWRGRLATMPDQWAGAVGERAVLMSHGSPWDADEYVYPDEARGAIARMAQGGEDLVVFGHTHYPVLCRSKNTIVVNPGSVGQPRDRRPGAAWALWDTDSHIVTLERTIYDHSRVVEESRRRDPALPYLADVFSRT